MFYGKTFSKIEWKKTGNEAHVPAMSFFLFFSPLYDLWPSFYVSSARMSAACVQEMVTPTRKKKTNKQKQEQQHHRKF